jgi:transcriptional regulator with GAF, ATPase, and Fis domain
VKQDLPCGAKFPALDLNGFAKRREGIVPRAQQGNTQTHLENELKTIFEISCLVQESDVDVDSFEEIIKTLGKLVDFRSASLFVVSGDAGDLEEICTVGKTVDLIDFVKFNMGSGISAWVAQKRRHIILNNLRKSRGGTRTRSFLSVPIVMAGEVTGVINLAHDEPDSFTQVDAEIVKIASSPLALLIERIKHRKNENKLGDEILSLNEQLTSVREKMAGFEKSGSSEDFMKALNEKLSNPLAIIAGNAQFLIMTMKNPGTSVLKRLKAIDREATNLIALTNTGESVEALTQADQEFHLNQT